MVQQLAVVKQYPRLVKALLLVLAVGLALLIGFRINQPVQAVNLLQNANFDRAELSNWQVVSQGEARLSRSEEASLLLEVGGTGWIGAGQQAPVSPVERYRLVVPHRLRFPGQSSATFIVRVSQFNAAGELVKEEEFAEPDGLTALPGPEGLPAWQAPARELITHWRAATVQVGFGLLGGEATRVEVDDVSLQVQPAWTTRVIHDPASRAAAVVLLLILGYVAGWPLAQTAVRVTRRQAAAARAALWRRTAWTALFFAALTLIVTYPVAWRLFGSLAGIPNFDPLQYVWYQWWVKEAILELGVWPDQATSLYFPLQLSHPVLLLHAFIALLSLPVTLFLGPVAAYNLALLVSFVLSGLAAYYLCLYLRLPAWAALLGGLIFAFYPNRMGHAMGGQITTIHNYFLPLYALSLLILLRRPSARIVIWHAVVTALLAMMMPMHIGYGIFPILLIIGGAELWSQLRRAANRWSRLKQAAQSLLVANLLAVLLYLPFAWSTLLRGSKFLSAADMDLSVADLLAFILPSPFHPLLLKLNLAPPPRLWPMQTILDVAEPLAYVGMVALALSFIALWRHWRHARAWGALGLVCTVLSLGPVLKMGGQDYGVALPYVWLERVPFFGWSRTVNRLNETVMLAVAVLAAFGLAWLLKPRLKGLGRPITRAAIYVCISGLILLEYIVAFPFPVETVPISDYYRQLAETPLDGGVLEVPARDYSNYAMFYQTIHEHPLAGGYMSRSPLGTDELKRMYHQLFWPWPAQQVFEPPLAADQIRAVLADMNIRRVIAHRSALQYGQHGPETLDYLSALFGPPIFEDYDLVVYEAPPGPAAWSSPWQLLPDQKNWEVIDDGAALRMEPKGSLYIYAFEPETVRLDLHWAGDIPPVDLRLSLNDDPIEPLRTGTDSGSFSFQLTLRDGFNYARLSTQPEQPVAFSKISIIDIAR